MSVMGVNVVPCIVDKIPRSPNILLKFSKPQLSASLIKKQTTTTAYSIYVTFKTNIDILVVLKWFRRTHKK